MGKATLRCTRSFYWHGPEGLYLRCLLKKIRSFKANVTSSHGVAPKRATDQVRCPKTPPAIQANVTCWLVSYHSCPFPQAIFTSVHKFSKAHFRRLWTSCEWAPHVWTFAKPLAMFEEIGPGSGQGPMCGPLFQKDQCSCVGIIRKSTIKTGEDHYHKPHQSVVPCGLIPHLSHSFPQIPIRADLSETFSFSLNVSNTEDPEIACFPTPDVLKQQ